MSTTNPDADNGTDDDESTCRNGNPWCPHRNQAVSRTNTPCFACFCAIERAAADPWTVEL